MRLSVADFTWLVWIWDEKAGKPKIKRTPVTLKVSINSNRVKPRDIMGKIAP
jgi:hypothetical protein